MDSPAVRVRYPLKQLMSVACSIAVSVLLSVPLSKPYMQWLYMDGLAGNMFP